jgi:hypothetical protein
MPQRGNPERKRFAGFTSSFDAQQNTSSVEVLGIPCTIFQDPGTATFLHDERHLLPWGGGDESNMVDRFDVRLL